MISFYPGPSKVDEQIPQFAKEAFEKGIVSINHRSQLFIEISKETIRLLKDKLNIPEDYWVFYTSSATECWEIIAQSLISKKSTHYYNGAFGEKWCNYTDKITNTANDKSFSIEEELLPQVIESDVICVTQNETSNGTAVNNDIIKTIKELNPDALVAVDATSSMAGIELKFENADVWFASLQKCFGLPAGMAIMICSPNAVNRAIKLNRNEHYNSLVFMIEKMKHFQTTHTPNVLSIYLLMRVMENRASIDVVGRQLQNRYDNWMSFFDSKKEFDHLIKNRNIHSTTVLPIAGSLSTITTLKEKAMKGGFLLGNGYGQWAATTFRIANFPSITDSEISQLQHFLRETLR